MVLKDVIEWDGIIIGLQNDAAFCWFSLTVAATSELYATAATTASETAISSAEGNTGVVAISEAVAVMAATSVAAAVAVVEIGVGVGVEVLDSGDWNAWFDADVFVDSGVASFSSACGWGCTWIGAGGGIWVAGGQMLKSSSNSEANTLRLERGVRLFNKSSAFVIVFDNKSLSRTV